MSRSRSCILATSLMLASPLFAQTLFPVLPDNAYRNLPDDSSYDLAGSCLLASTPNQALDTEVLTRALSSPSREVTDFLRDAARKPVQTLEFLGIKRGMRVLDLYAAGGYYTVVLSKAVGINGCVFAQNTERGRTSIEDRQNITQGEALDRKIREASLSNVTQLIAPPINLGLAPESLDFILLTLTLHDYANPHPQRASELLETLYALLRPGGILGISDHVGEAGNDNEALHRMPPQQAIKLAREAGFEVTTSDLLRGTADNHSRSIFDPQLARITDRFLLRLLKPAQ